MECLVMYLTIIVLLSFCVCQLVMIYRDIFSIERKLYNLQKTIFNFRIEDINSRSKNNEDN